MNLKTLNNTYKPILEEALQSYTTFDITDTRETLAKAIHYSVTANAKRIRPFIALSVFKMFSQNVEKILPFCCAVEMIHTYSLIHDDLPAMDDDDLRRGIPTCHKKFGENIAILAGDTLNTYAFEILSTELPNHYDAVKVLTVIKDLTIAFGIQGMAGGQALDLSSNSFSHEKLVHIHSLKTGAVLRACTTIPAYLENAPPQVYQVLYRFGTHLGLLFQIVDDILDVQGTSEALGKSPNKDFKQDKLTYVT
ncbi:MAG: polyprenyl synthetase family protein, partial [Candidatus Margulisbacteria bacterium]|nr:polyprenyl synthetase family protein [Candidatus Margulisiibacteriota bacterium]